ncbi:MAG: hypothetical protein JWO38_1137 [Gemmataceae bacterium]|nr:hypothetical protein [Gemmataceae bacterium]
MSEPHTPPIPCSRQIRLNSRSAASRGSSNTRSIAGPWSAASGIAYDGSPAGSARTQAG